jgi:hypothetical protein
MKKLEMNAPFSAKVETIIVITNQSPPIAYIAMKTTDGRRISLGGELEEDSSVVEFAAKLSEGQTYEFPRVWLEFRESKNNSRGQK